MVTLRIGMPIAQGERLPDSERLHAVELTKSTKIKLEGNVLRCLRPTKFQMLIRKNF